MLVRSSARNVGYPTSPLRFVEGDPFASKLKGYWIATDARPQNIAKGREVSTIVGYTQSAENGGAISDFFSGITTNTYSDYVGINDDYCWGIKYKLNSAASGVVYGNREGGTSSPLQFMKLTEGGLEYYNDGNQSTWTHSSATDTVFDILIVKRGDVLNYYLDGVLDGTDTVTKSIDANPVLISSGTPGGLGETTDITFYHAFHGPIAPTPEKITQLYQDPYHILERDIPKYYFVESAAPPAGAYSPVIERYYRTLMAG